MVRICSSPDVSGLSKHHTNHTGLYIGTTTPHRPFFSATPAMCMNPTRQTDLIPWWRLSEPCSACRLNDMASSTAMTVPPIGSEFWQVIDCTGRSSDPYSRSGSHRRPVRLPELGRTAGVALLSPYMGRCGVSTDPDVRRALASNSQC